MGCSRGQTSVEMLLVTAFVILVSLAIVLPYVDSQNKTNASVVAKLAVIPFIEKNNLRIRINSISPEVLPNNALRMHIVTTGTWDGQVDDDLSLGQPPSPSGCVRVCAAIASLGAYSSVELAWLHNSLPYCSNTSCVP